MFVVTEAEAAAIHTAFEQEGELSAAIELRRLFPGVTDNAKARLQLPAPEVPISITRHAICRASSRRFSGLGEWRR
jgi:hypothetical protein